MLRFLLLNFHGQAVFASKGQQLLRQVCRAIAGCPDFFEITSDLIVGVRTLKSQTAVAADAGEQVVEIVGQPGGQLAHFFHLEKDFSDLIVGHNKVRPQKTT